MCLSVWTAPCLNPGLRRRLARSKSKLRLTRKWPNVLINPLFLQKLSLHNLTFFWSTVNPFLYKMLKFLLWKRRFKTFQQWNRFVFWGSSQSQNTQSVQLQKNVFIESPVHNCPKNPKPCCSQTATMLRAGKLFCCTNSISWELQRNVSD